MTSDPRSTYIASSSESPVVGRLESNRTGFNRSAQPGSRGVFRWFFAFLRLPVLLGCFAVPSMMGSPLIVSWADNSDNESGFRIERSVDGSTFEEIAVVGADAVTYRDVSVASMTTYWYRVRAYNETGNSSYSIPASGNSGLMKVARGEGISLEAPGNINTANLVRVDYFSGSTKIGEATSAPYSFSWIGATLGIHSISAVAVFNDESTEILYQTDVSVVLPPRTTGLSTRGVVDNSDPLIVGFKVSGTGPQRVLIRAVGEGLEAFGVSDVIYEPSITVFASGSSEFIAQKLSGWDAESDRDAISDAIAATGIFSFQPGSRDAAVLVDLPAGEYTAVVGDSARAGGVCLVEAYLVDDPLNPSNRGELSNLSTRGFVGRGGEVIIAGIFVDGSTPKRLLVRGIGPGLSEFGVPSVLENPQISVIAAGGESPIAGQDNWSTDALEAAQIESATETMGAFALADGSNDAALLIDLDPGLYTIQLSPASGASGTGLIEVYEVSP